jgi:hypothetical protein
MTGYPSFNFPAFDAAAKDLRERGIGVISPAEMDDPETRDAAMASLDGAPGSGTTNGEKWEDFLARDIQIVADSSVDAVVVLDGWHESKGATFETDVARRLGKPVLHYPDLALVEWEAPNRAPADGEVRITDPKTGGQKGRKPERYDLIPWAAMDPVARVYAMGAEKYEDHNYLKGYAWSLSLGAMLRHITQWARGEDLDDESGETHLAHVAWHALALIMFELHGLGTDDRWRPPAPDALDPELAEAVLENGPLDGVGDLTGGYPPLVLPCMQRFSCGGPSGYLCELSHDHDGPHAAPAVDKVEAAA